MSKITLRKIQEIQKREKLLSLISKIRNISITDDNGLKKHRFIVVDSTKKSLSVTHPDYEKISFENRQYIVDLIKNFGYYIQWEFYIIN